MQPLSILVTGANGLIGHRLCRRLLEDGHMVAALSRAEHPALLKPLREHGRLRLFRGDITDREFCRKLFRANRFDAVFHLAVARYFPDPAAQRLPALEETEAYRTNYEGTLNLFQAALGSGFGLPVWVQGSAMMVYDIEHLETMPVAETHPAAPVEPNGFSVLLAEEACRYFGRSAGLHDAILRFPGVYGTGKESGVIAKFVRHCLSGNPAPLEAPGNRTSDFLYAEDAAEALLLALSWLQANSGELPAADRLFHIGSGEEVSVAEAARLIRELTGANIDIVERPAAVSRRFCFDNTRARKVLGFRPRSLREGMSEYVNELMG